VTRAEAFPATMLARCRPLPRRWYSTKSNAENELLLLNIPHADVFRFGDAPPATPLFSALDWRVRDDEAWAVIGHGSARKTQLLEVAAALTLVELII
jgi:ABC-type molybdenum transport system ATPase subunit/photorepair protein PhrA